MQERKKCEHEICKCYALEDDNYCSDRCRDSHDQDLTEISCDCGHSGCDISDAGVIL